VTQAVAPIVRLAAGAAVKTSSASAVRLAAGAEPLSPPGITRCLRAFTRLHAGATLSRTLRVLREGALEADRYFGRHRTAGQRVAAPSDRALAPRIEHGARGVQPLPRSPPRNHRAP